MTTRYTSTNIANVIAKEVRNINTSGLDSCLFVTQGGTSYPANTELLDLTESEVDLALADGNAITAITPTYVKPTTLAGQFKTVSAMTSISRATENTVWTTGTVTLDTDSAHSLPMNEQIYVRFAGYEPTNLNGDRLVTVVDTDSLSFELTDDPGAVTTEGTVSVIKATITGHGIPVTASLTTSAAAWSGGVISLTVAGHGLVVGTKFYADLAGFSNPTALNGKQLITVYDANTLRFPLSNPGTITDAIGTVYIFTAIYSQFTGIYPALLNREHLTVYTDANSAYFPFNSVAGTITVTSARVRVAKLNLVNNGLANNIPLPIYVSGVDIAIYNGAKKATVSGEYIYYGVNTGTVAPNIANAKVSYVIADVAGTLAEDVGIKNTYSISGALPVAYNANWDSVVTDTNTFVFAPAGNLGAVTQTGQVLDLDAEILRKMKVSFFLQNTGLKVSVFECGTGTVAEGIIAFDNYLFDNPQKHHAVVLPTGWDTAGMAAMWASHTDSLNDFSVVFIPVSSYTNQINFVGQKQTALMIDSNNAGNDEYLAAGAAALFCYQTASSANKLATFTYADLVGFTPYSFESVNADLKKELDARGIMYVVDQAEGGSADVCVYNGVCQGKDDFGNWIDLSSIWAKNYMIVDLDERLAAFLFENRRNPDMRFSLNDSGGQLAIRQTVAVCQAAFNEYASSAVCEPVTVQFTEYHRWKAANPALQAAKNLSNNLNVTTSVARGLFKVTFNLGVSF